MHAIVLLSHFHSLSSFVFSCGLTQQLAPTSSLKYKTQSPQKSPNASPSPTSGRGFTFRTNSNSNSPPLTEQRQEVSVDALMARMRTLSQKQDECSEMELNQRFKSVEMQVCARATRKRFNHPNTFHSNIHSFFSVVVYFLVVSSSENKTKTGTRITSCHRKNRNTTEYQSFH